MKKKVNEQENKNLSKWRKEFNEVLEENSFKELEDLVNKLDNFDEVFHANKKIRDEEIEKLEKEINDIIKKHNLDPVIENGLKRLYMVIEKRKERSMSDNFGSLIKYIRKEKGMSLQDVSQRSGVSQSYINRIEKGERKTPSFTVIKKIAEALDVDVKDLIGYEIESKPEEKIVSVEELLLKNNYTVKGKTITTEVRNLLVDIVKYINEADWSNDKKVENFIKLSAKIDAYKELID